MNDANDLPIKKYTILGFGLILFLFILVGTISFIEINSLESLTTTIYNHHLKVSNAALHASISTVKMRSSMKDVVLADDSLSLEEHIAYVSEYEKLVIKNLDVIKGLILGSEGQSLERETREISFAWRPIREEVIQLVRSGETKKAAQITTGKGAKHEFLLEQQMQKLTDYAHDKANEIAKHSMRIEKRFLLFTGITVVVGTLLLILIAFVTTRQILSSLDLYRKAEEARLESIQRFKQLSKISPVGIFISDIDGKTEYWNDMLCKITGMSIEEGAGEGWAEGVHPDDQERVFNQWNESTNARADFRSEYRFIDREGNITWTVGQATSILNPQGETTGFIGTITDITDLKLAEKEREKLIKDLKKALKEIKTLKGIIPICMHCKEIRDDKGCWNKLEKYITEHSDAQFSHGLCKKCEEKYYSENIE